MIIAFGILFYQEENLTNTNEMNCRIRDKIVGIESNLIGKESMGLYLI